MDGNELSILRLALMDESIKNDDYGYYWHDDVCNDNSPKEITDEIIKDLLDIINNQIYFCNDIIPSTYHYTIPTMYTDIYKNNNLYKSKNRNNKKYHRKQLNK